eukprot:SAG31_NODE_36785_length_310_cov_0.857820_1_plen_54_part_01
MRGGSLQFQNGCADALALAPAAATDVWIGYCDGSSFSGRVEGLHKGLHYRGRPN